MYALFFCSFLQSQRPISMKKENIQSRNRKLSAKSRKKHNSFTAEMLKPFEKMYSYGMAAGAGMAGHMGSAGMTGSMASSYYMPPPHQGTSSSASMHAQFGASAASMHPMANPFGTSSFSGMVSTYYLGITFFETVMKKVQVEQS